MKILLIGNGYLSMAHQELYIAAGLKEAGNEVIVVHDPDCSVFNKGYIPPPLTQEDIIPKSPEDHEVVKGLRGIDFCLALDQSVAMLAKVYAHEYRCPTSCIILDYPRHIIDEGSPQDYDPEYSSRYYTALNHANDLPMGLIFTSKSMAIRASTILAKPPYYFYYPVCTTNAIDDRPFGGHTGFPYVATTHRFFHYKGTEYLVQALHEIMVDYCAAFAGGFIEPQVVAFAKRMLGNQFHPYPRIDEVGKWRMVKNAKLLCYPSISGWSGGMSVLEAMAVGTPVVCSDFALYRELFGDCVIYTDPKNIDDLQEKILMVLNHEIDLAELTNRAKERIDLMFTPKQAGNALTQIMEHMCNENSSSG